MEDGSRRSTRDDGFFEVSIYSRHANVPASGIGVTAPDDSYRLFFRDAERLCWPDAISAGRDGLCTVTVNKLHRTAQPNAGKDEPEPPNLHHSFPAARNGSV